MNDRIYFALRKVIADAKRDLDFVMALWACGISGNDTLAVQARAERRYERATRILEARMA